MNNRVPLGRSGLTVSPVICGTWQASPLWGDQSDAALLATWRAAFAAEINTFDTASNYGDGRAETLLGSLLPGWGRENVVVVTKAYCLLRPDGKRVFNLHGDNLYKTCEASLARLKTDYIDCYLLHAFDPSADPAEASDALENLKQAGKIRAYGVSNYTADQLRMARHFGNYTVLQPLYNLIDAGAENDLLPAALAAGVGVMAYCPQAMGLLTGKYAGDETFADTRGRNPRFQGETFRTWCAKVRGLQPFADKYGLSIAQLALACALHHPAVTTAIAGAKTPEQIREAAGAMGKQIETEDYWDIRDALAWPA